MNEYIIPARYQNVGCGISVKVAGLENTYRNYKKIEISKDGLIFIETTINQNNLDCSNIVTFDELEENKYYTIHAKLTTNDGEVIKNSCKILPQVQTATVELSHEMKIEQYLGGGLHKKPQIKGVI